MPGGMGWLPSGVHFPMFGGGAFIGGGACWLASVLAVAVG